MGTPEHAAKVERDSPESIVAQPRRLERPWGHEVIWAETDEYAAKLLHVHVGEGLALRLHEDRDKTMLLLRGEIVLEVGPGVNSLGSVKVREGEAFRIRPGVLHRITAVTAVEMVEASTAELDDVIRVRDGHDGLQQMGEDAE